MHGLRKMLLIGLASGAVIAAGEETPAEKEFRCLGSPKLTERNRVREELEKRLASSTGKERKRVFQEVRDMARAHADPEVRDKAHAALAPYAVGSAVWERTDVEGADPIVPVQVDVLEDGGLLVWGGTVLMRVDPRTGTPVWRQKPEHFPSRLFEVTATARKVRAFGGGAWVKEFDPKTGELLGELQLKGIVDNPRDLLEVDGDWITLCGGPAHPITRFDGKTGEPRWTGIVGWIKTVDSRLGIVVYVDDDGSLKGIRWADGKALWKFRPVDKGRWGEVRVCGNHIAAIRLRDEGAATLIALDVVLGKTALKVEIPEGPPSLFSVVDEGILLASAGGFVRLYDPARGKPVWDARLDPSEHLISAQLAPGGVLIACAREGGKGRVALLARKTGKPLWEREGLAWPGEPDAVQLHGDAAVISGAGDTSSEIWIEVYALADGAVRARTRLHSIDPIGQFRVFKDRAVTWDCPDIGSASRLNMFDLKSGKQTGSLEWGGSVHRIQLLPEGLLVSGYFEDGLQRARFGVYRLYDAWDE